MQKVLKNIVWGCLFLIPFVALYVADGSGIDFIHWNSAGLFFPFITGKNLAFRLLVEVAFFSWIILAINDAKYRIKKSPLLLAYGLFILIILIADLFGVDIHESIWSNFERMEGFVAHIHLFAYFVVLISMLTTEGEWLNMFRAFVASNILVMAHGFMQLLGSKDFFFSQISSTTSAMAAKISENFPIHQSGNRLDATIGNSAYYAIYCLFFAFLATLLYTQSKTRFEKWIYGIIVVLNLISLFYTGTRGTLVGLLVAVFCTLIIIAWRERGKVRRNISAVLVVAVILVGSVFVFKDTSFIKNSPTLSRFSTMSFDTDTGGSRMTIWKMSYEAWKERPILGYGQDNFIYVFPRQFIADKMYNQEPWFDRSHDVFFDWLVAGGILGLLSYLSLFVIAVYLLWKRGENIHLREKAIITGVLIGYFVHNIFVFDNLTSYILFFALLAYIVARTSNGSVYGGNRSIGDWKEIMTPIVALLFVTSFYFTVYIPHATNTNLIKALDVGRLMQADGKSFSEVLGIQKDSFNYGIEANLTGRQEVDEQLFQTVPKMLNSQIPADYPVAEANKINQAKQDLFAYAQDRASTTSEGIYKDNVRVLNIMGEYYNAVGDAKDADKVLTQALSSSPNKQLIIFDLVRAYIGEGKINQAYDEAQRAYMLQPAYDAARKTFVIAAIYANKLSEVEKILSLNNQEIPVDGDVINALVQNNQKGEAIKLLNNYKKENPSQTAEVDKVIKEVNSK